MTYNHLVDAPIDAETRIKWLMHQRPSHLWKNFKPQPFEQITKVLRADGHEGQSVTLAINKLDHKQKVRVRTARGWFRKSLAVMGSSLVWLFYGRLNGYGYKFKRSLMGLFAVWLVCATYFSIAANKGVFAPSHPLVFYKYDQKPDCAQNWVNCINDDNKNPELQAYTAFSPWVYSLDVMLPIVNLHQETDWGPMIKGFAWIPRQDIPKAMPHWAKPVTQGALNIFSYIPLLGQLSTNRYHFRKHWIWRMMWVEILLGWMGSLFLAALLSGLIKKE